MKHIAGKLFLGFLCMVGVAVALLWVLQAGLMRNNALNARVAALDSAIQQAAEQADADFAPLEDQLNARFVKLDAAGRVLYLSQSLPMKGMLLKAMQGDTLPTDGSVQQVTAMGDMAYAVLGRQGADGARIYGVFSLADEQRASQLLLQQLWIVTAVLLVAAVLLAIVLSRLFSRPVRAITAVAKALADGRYDTKAAVFSADEIGDLAVALNELGTQLEKTEDLRRELIANVSHELRGPLAVIQGYAETVRDVTWPQEEKRQQQLTMVAQEAARLSRVVEDILDYSRLQAGVASVEPQAVPLCAALEQAVQIHELDAQKKSMQIDLHCDAVTIRFDPIKLTQVMDNLIQNAINHGDAGTTLVVEARRRGPVCRISVANTGDTIAPDELPHIWERYYRAHTVGESRRLGTGLGLAIVRTILVQHGCAYGVQSDQRLTEFWFEPPIVD